MNIEHVRIIKQEERSSEYTVLELDAPSISALVSPGQFVYMLIPNFDASALRRPFSVFKAEDGVLSILYKTVGKGTKALRKARPGDEISLMGPLGNGYPLDIDNKFPILVAGGYGVAPLCFLAKQLPTKGIIFIGGRTEKDILCVEELKSLGWGVWITTEDGSLGEEGLVTNLIDSWLRNREENITPEFFACGPDGLLKAIGERAISGDYKAWLSLEKHMGCGVGACLGCVHKIIKDGKEEWGRVCKDGPVFESREIVW